MRQAGRCLPEYRRLRERHSFRELVRTPELAAEVSLQPVRRFGYDAAIVFSDILTVPEAMGMGYSFEDGAGMRMAWRIERPEQVKRLSADSIRERLAYAPEAIRLLKERLEGRQATIGFSGAPWTLACFMIEGGGGEDFSRARRFLAEHPAAYRDLAERLTEAIVEHLRAQIEAGADAVQLFETLAWAAGPERFPEASLVWIERILRELGGRAPTIVFVKGIPNAWEALARAGAQVVSLDAAADLPEVARRLPPGVATQGNLPPELLLAEPEAARAAARAQLEAMRGRPGYIVNLGHGVPPNARLETIQALVETVRNFS